MIKNYHQKHTWKNISPLSHPDVFRSFSVALPFLIVRDFYTEYFLLINWMTIRLFLTLGPPCHHSQPSPWLDLLKTYSYDSILINIYKPTPTTQVLINIYIYIYIYKSQKILFHIRSLVRLSPTKEGKRSIVIVCVWRRWVTKALVSWRMKLINCPDFDFIRQMKNSSRFIFAGKLIRKQSAWSSSNRLISTNTIHGIFQVWIN